jgi:competence protein ComEC
LLGVCAFVTLVLLFVLKKHLCVTFILLSICWLGVVGHLYKYWMPSTLVFNKPVLVHAIVSDVHLDSTPQSGSQSFANSRFNASISKVGKNTLLLNPLVRITWRRALGDHQKHESIKQGDILKLLVVMKTPSGLANPDGFQYQKWLASKNIVATGYVKPSPSNKILSSQPSLRQQLLDKMQLLKLRHKAELMALSLGVRTEITQETWSLIQQTGTAHLFAISGLHLGVVSMFAFFLCKPLVATASMGLVWISRLRAQFSVKRSTHSQITPQHSQTHHFSFKKSFKQHRINHISLIICLLVSSLYAHLAGFELPVTRALVAVSLVTICGCLILHWKASTSLIYLVFLCLVLMPLSVLSISFWFSFSAVFIIFFILWRLRNSQKSTVDKFIHACKVQVVLCLLTLPIVAYHFQIVSLISPIANFIAVPVVSFLVVPLCLLATICLIFDWQSISFLLFQLANETISILFMGLQWASAFEFAVFEIAKIGFGAICLFVSALFVLFLPYAPYKKCVSVLLLVPFISYFLPTKHNMVSLDVFDVGHGLAAFVNSTNTTILYDTGASYPSGFSIASSVIQPFLKAKGVAKVDHVFISHDDIDHSGGLTFLKKNKLFSNLHGPANTCNQRSSQVVKDMFVSFKVQILWPITQVIEAENDDSCVLKLTHRLSQTSILFAGDIEKKAEQALVELDKQNAIDLSSDILIAPHHGSKTSSSPDFIKAVSAKYVVFSSRYNGRWKLPNQEVINRYHAANTVILHTGEHGRIQFEIDKQIVVKRYRQDEANYWYLKP